MVLPSIKLLKSITENTIVNTIIKKYYTLLFYCLGVEKRMGFMFEDSKLSVMIVFRGVIDSHFIFSV